ncbi:hypothetical protein OIU76_017641 [Salix suchowensis]|nr:hypothetical protein OIU76_017641 [Salix suchowensis]
MEAKGEDNFFSFFFLFSFSFPIHCLPLFACKEVKEVNRKGSLKQIGVVLREDQRRWLISGTTHAALTMRFWVSKVWAIRFVVGFRAMG